MTKESKYISVENAVKTTWMVLDGLGYAFDENPQLKETISAVFDTAPAVDVVEVVRCKDCKYNMANIVDIQDGVNINENWNACDLTELYEEVRPDDFCSRGAKMEVEQG